MDLIGSPPQNEFLDSTGQGKPMFMWRPTTAWTTFFSNAYQIIAALVLSGTTANRPTKFLWTGRPYFDTTLGKPIWYKTAGWVDATGAGV